MITINRLAGWAHSIQGLLEERGDETQRLMNCIPLMAIALSQRMDRLGYRVKASSFDLWFTVGNEPCFVGCHVVINARLLPKRSQS
jgi:hypothetical protein